MLLCTFLLLCQIRNSSQTKKGRVCDRLNRGQETDKILKKAYIRRFQGKLGCVAENKVGEMLFGLQNDTTTTAPRRLFTVVLAIIATGGITGAAHESGTSSLLLLKVRLAVNRVDEYNDKHN